MGGTSLWVCFSYRVSLMGGTSFETSFNVGGTSLWVEKRFFEAYRVTIWVEQVYGTSFVNGWNKFAG
jgi:hypothetical protein